MSRFTRQVVCLPLEVRARVEGAADVLPTKASAIDRHVVYLPLEVPAGPSGAAVVLAVTARTTYMSASVDIIERQPYELSRKTVALAITNVIGVVVVVAVVGWKTQLRGQLIGRAAIVEEYITSCVCSLDVMLSRISHFEWQQ